MYSRHDLPIVSSMKTCFPLRSVNNFVTPYKPSNFMGTTMKLQLALIAAISLGTIIVTQAHADTVNATLAAQYFEVANSTDPDFPGAFPDVAANSTLGPNGLPVGTGVKDVDSSGEITWWSPALNANVKATGVGTISLPYASNMYAPDSTGTNDSKFYETAVFTGAFTLASASTVSFDLGSDDDSFIYVDGTLFGQNPGIHSDSTVDFTSPTLDAGNHEIEVFYADREQSGAYLSLNLDAASSSIVITPPPVSGVPEPGTWLLMFAGIGGIGLMLRRAGPSQRPLNGFDLSKEASTARERSRAVFLYFGQIRPVVATHDNDSSGAQ
jgi:hypothetical protein